MVSNIVFVKNIPNLWTAEELIKVFSEFGQILSANIKNDNTLKPYGIICYGKIGEDNIYGKQCALLAIQKLNGFQLNNSSHLLDV